MIEVQNPSLDYTGQSLRCGEEKRIKQQKAHVQYRMDKQQGPTA